jgi:ubiquinol-cytochrome c reductase cytochrome c subunit
MRRLRISGPLALIGAALIAGAVFFMFMSPARGQQGGTSASTAPVSLGTSASGSQVTTDPADIAAGEQLYDEHCESCHGYQGRGGENGAPALVSVGAAAADFYLSTGRMPLNNPANQPLSHRPFFTPTEIAQLDSYIADLPNIVGSHVYGPSIPSIEPLCPTSTPQAGCVTLSQGFELYSLNCTECHQAAGAGNMLSKGNVIPGLHQVNLTQIAEAMRVGPKPMPIFGPGELSDAQVSAIAHYVRSSLQNTNGPGGFGLGGMGPVVEGFVGVLAGFGLLIFAARMIGNRG